MPKVAITVSADYDTGEAGLTKGAKLELEKLILANSLLAADILKDCVYDFTELYNRALKKMRLEDDARREAAKT